jgi:hypothetical protein
LCTGSTEPIVLHMTRALTVGIALPFRVEDNDSTFAQIPKWLSAHGIRAMINHNYLCLSGM